MQIHHYWQDIIFLPVVNSLIEEQLHRLESNFMEDRVGNSTILKEQGIDAHRIAEWGHLYQSWKSSPNKTSRQVEWLRTLRQGMEHLKRQLHHHPRASLPPC